MTAVGEWPPARAPGAVARRGAGLVVLVQSGCVACRRSLQRVAQVRAARPDVSVHVLDAAAEPVLPVTLIGTPMWLHDGRVRWLGTPELQEVLAALPAPRPARAGVEEVQGG